MREKWEELKKALEGQKTLTVREYLLILAVCGLSGLVLGMLLSPKKRVMIGSNNGNNNVGGLSAPEDTLTGETDGEQKKEDKNRAGKGEKRQ